MMSLFFGTFLQPGERQMAQQIHHDEIQNDLCSLTTIIIITAVANGYTRLICVIKGYIRLFQLFLLRRLRLK